jgi:hypothetical protein
MYFTDLVAFIVGAYCFSLLRVKPEMQTYQFFVNSLIFMAQSGKWLILVSSYAADIIRS